MSSACLIRPDWAAHPPWNRISATDRERLDAFLAYMRDPRNFETGSAFSEFTILQYWTRVRQAILDGDMIAILDRPGKAAARATTRQAVAVWANFVGGVEGEKLKSKIESMREAAKQKGPRGGRNPREDRLALSEDDWIRLRERAGRDRDVKAIVLQILLRSSLRIGDALRIERDAVEEGLETGELRVLLKGRHTVTFPVEPIKGQLERLVKLEDWDTVEDLLGGSYWAAMKRVSRRLKYYAEEVGIADVYPHRLRYTMLTYMAHGTGTAMAQALAGHESSETTARYTKRPPSTKVLGEAMMRILGEE